MTKLKTVSLKNLKVGDKLPEVPIEITSTMVIAGAIASHDFTPVHHDKSAAQAQGMQDVFMNILATNGLVGKYVTDWAGPNATLQKVAIKLGAPNFPGDTMKMTGVVKAKEESAGVVDLEVVGRNSWGNHVTAQVRIALPKEA